MSTFDPQLSFDSNTNVVADADNSYRVHCRMKDPTLVGASVKLLIKTAKVTATSENEAKEKAIKFYKARGYKNIDAYLVEHSSRNDSDDVVNDAEAFKVGERVTHLDGRFGMVERITGDYVRVKGDDGETFTVKSEKLRKL